MKISEEHIPDLIRNNADDVVISHLYEELFPTVQHYIVKNKGIADDAYDVFQDAVLYFYNQVVSREFDSKYSVYGYIYRLSINRWINKLNKDKRIVFKSELKEFNNFEEDLNIVDHEIDLAKNHGNLLEKFFKPIGEKCIEILTYRIYNNLMVEDIAIRMNFSSEAAVKMRIKRCRESMMEELKKNPEIINKLKGI